MSNPIKVRFKHEEFDRTMQKYREFSKRTTDSIVNTKGFFIARRTVLETPKTPREKVLAFMDLEGGAVMGKIINKRRGAKGLPGLYGKAMAKAVNKIKGSRLRSIAFLRSGWIAAIKALEPYAEKRMAPPRDRSLKQRGKPKGYGKPSVRSTWVAKAVIANTAQARWDKGKAEELGLAALRRAFDAEVASMKWYIENKMREQAIKAYIKTW